MLEDQENRFQFKRLIGRWLSQEDSHSAAFFCSVQLNNAYAHRNGTTTDDEFDSPGFILTIDRREMKHNVRDFAHLDAITDGIISNIDEGLHIFDDLPS